MRRLDADRPNVENTTSKANRIDVRQPSLLSSNAAATARLHANQNKPWDQRDWQQEHKDRQTTEKFGEHFRVNGGRTFGKGDVYDE